jgi:uncharacterized protein (TIGR03437 family)
MNRLISCCISVFCLLIPSALPAQTAKPVIAGPVLNGASMHGFTPSLSGPEFQGLGLAGGSIFVVFGSGLGPAELVLGKIPYPDQLPSGPGGTRVTFRSLVTEEIFTAYLIHSWQSQVSGIVPSKLPLGLAEVTVSYGGMESDPTLVGISDTHPALFTVSESGQGPAVAQNYESVVSQPLNSLTHPAAPGQYIILWGTGLGPIGGPDNVRPSAGNLRDDISVRFASGADEIAVPAEYAGRSPQFPGVDQINVRIPDDVDLGCYQELGLQIGHHGFGSLGTIAISDTPGQCDHPWGLSPQKLADLESGGTLTFMHLYLGSSYVNGRIANADATGVASNVGSSAGRNRPPPFRYACSPGQFITLGDGSTPTAPAVTPLPAGLFGADPGQLRLVGPDLRAVQVVRDPYYAGSFRAKSDLPEGFLIPGEWTLRSTGGRDVASFAAAFEVAPLPFIDLPTSISRSADIELSWDPAPYQAGEQLQIDLREANPGQTSGNSIFCYLPASAGSITIGAGSIASLEAEAGSTLLWQMTLYPSPVNFTAPGLAHGQILAQPSVRQEASLVE